MLAANELRIGNWYYEFGNYRQTSWSILKTLSESTESQIWCKPIPLAPEILEKFGFEKDNDGIYSKLGFMFWLDDIGVMQLALNYSPICNAPCKYVHQLQNLIHALTGEEITFKP